MKVIRITWNSEENNMGISNRMYDGSRIVCGDLIEYLGITATVVGAFSRRPLIIGIGAALYLSGKKIGRFIDRREKEDLANKIDQESKNEME